MFVYNYCKEHALNCKEVCIGYSRGSCELCNLYDICNDLKAYTCKDNWQELVYKEERTVR